MFRIAAAMILMSAGIAYAATPDPSAISKSKSVIANGMRDPSSAQFRDVKVAGRCDGVTYVTGWANGKNGYGGYAGFMIFLIRVENGAPVVMQAYGNAYATDAEFHTAAVCNGNAAK